MEVSKIIKKVRWCIDEETGYQDFDDTYMNNIIKAHMGDALRWCCMYGDSSLLNDGSSSSSSGIIKDYSIIVKGETSIEVKVGTTVVTDSHIEYNKGVLTLPTNFLKVARVRCTGWHKAIMTPIAEDSEEYLMLYDDTSKATKERPQVALIESCPQRVELWPTPATNDEIQLTFIVNPSENTTGTGENESYGIPDKVSTAFIYYLAFLVLSAYNDVAKANSMLAIAKMHLGQTTA